MPEPTEEVTEPVDNPEVTTDESVSEAAEPGNESEVEPVAEKTEEPEFTDLKSLPPELEGIGKKMQADYTRKMQRLSEAQKAREVEALRQPPQEEFERTRAFFETPEGQAFKGTMKDMFYSETQDLREKVYDSESKAEISSAIQKYGRESLTDNYPKIKEVMEQYPNMPLDIACSSVMYESAKTAGANEYKTKLTQKSEQSATSPSSTGNTVPAKEIKGFDDAFAAALDQQK